MSEHSRAYLKGLFCFDAVVQRTEPRLWDNPSPCERWTARDVVSHNVFVCTMIAEMTRGHPAAVPPESVEPPVDRLYPAPGQDGYVMAPRLMRRFVGRDDDPLPIWNRHRDDVLEALDQPGVLQIETRSPWGATTVDGYLGFAFFDPLVHAWDLSKAVGLEPVLDADLAQQALDAVATSSTQYELRQRSVLSEAVTTERRDPVSRLLAFCGRQP